MIIYDHIRSYDLWSLVDEKTTTTVLWLVGQFARANPWEKLRKWPWKWPQDLWKIWVRQWEGWHPIYYLWKNKTCSKPPTRYLFSEKGTTHGTSTLFSINNEQILQLQPTTTMFSRLFSTSTRAKSLPPTFKNAPKNVLNAANTERKTTGVYIVVDYWRVIKGHCRYEFPSSKFT